MRIQQSLCALALVLASSQALMACVWCEPDVPIAVLTHIQKDARTQARRSALLSGIVDNKSQREIAAVSLMTTPELCGQKPPLDDRFYTDYLLSYFPKAPVMTSLLFPTMCAEALHRALVSLTYFINHSYWRYFANEPDAVYLERVHLEIISAQLEKVVRYVQNLMYDVASGRIEKRSLHTMRKKMMPLVQWWNVRQKMDGIYQACALFLDSYIHRLYGAVSNQDCAQVSALQRKFNDYLPLVRGSRFEARYAKISQLYRELGKLLYERQWDNVYRRNVQESQLINPLELWRKQRGVLSGPEAFVASFIAHYECNVTGKFTHEYHPALLEKTAESFSKLEAAFTQEQMPLVGRYVLMGYEEQGVPRYRTHFDDALLADEMETKTNAGFSAKMFNRFGLLTGFLFKDVDKHSVPITHIDAQMIEIFQGTGTLFQEHAFGDAYAPLMRAYGRTAMHLKSGDVNRAFRECSSLWNTLYSGELRVSGKQHVAGTQDVLFSLAYMDYVQHSQTPLLHFYVGPDITYPIEVSLAHSSEATRHAQNFVKTFLPQLTPINGKKTAYVFCSFVDGVGKSTMLGNVQNWMQYGADVSKYEHVDNSSSQLATIFDFAPDVVIADLPAQVSHFTYKPDGYVYVDISAFYEKASVAELLAYVHDENDKLCRTHDEMMRRIGVRCVRDGYDIDALNAENPEYAFAALVDLLKKQSTNRWVSFTYRDKQYLFSRDDTTQIRVRMPLADAPSHGLKNLCPEQMIFTRGIRFPFAYDTFVSDLTKRLKQAGVEQVVMVDFMSMYSRSSRENIRVNYIVQQLSLVYYSFALKKSFYQDFVDNAQLLGELRKPLVFAQYRQALIQESVVRYVLFCLLDRYGSNGLSGVSLNELTTLIREQELAMPDDMRTRIERLVDRKLQSELAHLQAGYGFSRDYLTLHDQKLSDLVPFTEMVCGYGHEYGISHSMRAFSDSMQQASFVRRLDGEHGTTNTGIKVKVLGCCHRECSDKTELLSFTRTIRSAITAYVANFLYPGKERFPTLPTRVLPDQDGFLCIVQPELMMVAEKLTRETPDYSLFYLPRSVLEPTSYWLENDEWHVHAWEKVMQTCGGAYACGHEQTRERTGAFENMWAVRPIVTNLYSEYAKEVGEDKVMTYEELWRRMRMKVESLKNNKDRWRDEAKRNGLCPDDSVPPSLENRRSFTDRGGKVYGIAREQIPYVQLFMRIVATLESVCKDVEADFVARRGNKNDFIACLAMLEAITIPWIYGLFSDEPLFDDYATVEPIIALAQ